MPITRMPPLKPFSQPQEVLLHLNFLSMRTYYGIGIDDMKQQDQELMPRNGFGINMLYLPTAEIPKTSKKYQLLRECTHLEWGPVTMVWRHQCPQFKCIHRDFPGVQWLRIHLSMQGIRVQTLVREHSTCLSATKPVRHNYWTPRSATKSDHPPPHSLQLEKAKKIQTSKNNFSKKRGIEFTFLKKMWP